MGVSVRETVIGHDRGISVIKDLSSTVVAAGSEREESPRIRKRRISFKFPLETLTATHAAQIDLSSNSRNYLEGQIRGPT